jgi:archaellum component FlaC
MKLDNLKQLVKEELKRALNEEELKDQVPTEPGKYKIEYTTDDGTGADFDVIEITQNDIDDAINSNTNSLWFWKSLIDNNLFGRGDRVMNVGKMA